MEYEIANEMENRCFKNQYMKENGTIPKWFEIPNEFKILVFGMK